MLPKCFIHNVQQSIALFSECEACALQALCILVHVSPLGSIFSETSVHRDLMLSGYSIPRALPKLYINWSLCSLGFIFPNNPIPWTCILWSLSLPNSCCILTYGISFIPILVPIEYIFQCLHALAPVLVPVKSQSLIVSRVFIPRSQCSYCFNIPSYLLYAPSSNRSVFPMSSSSWSVQHSQYDIGSNTDGSLFSCLKTVYYCLDFVFEIRHNILQWVSSNASSLNLGLHRLRYRSDLQSLSGH